MGMGEYWHLGLENSLKKCLSGKIHNDIKISLKFNIDELHVYASPRDQLWPILCQILELNSEPLVVGMYYGKSKPPSAAEYLRMFVDEFKILLDSGLEVNEFHVTIEVRCFICDTPARCFIKGIKELLDAMATTLVSDVRFVV